MRTFVPPGLRVKGKRSGRWILLMDHDTTPNPFTQTSRHPQMENQNAEPPQAPQGINFMNIATTALRSYAMFYMFQQFMCKFIHFNYI